MRLDACYRRRAKECGINKDAYLQAAAVLLYWVSGHLLQGEPVRLTSLKGKTDVTLTLDRYGIHFVDETKAQAVHGCSLDELEPRLLLLPDRPKEEKTCE